MQINPSPEVVLIQTVPTPPEGLVDIVGSLAFFVNPVLYWLHERGWNIWQWGRFSDDRRKFKEGNWRSLGKDVTWRIVITGSNFVLPYFVIGSFGDALKVMGVATLVNMTIFFCHERIWNFFGWGCG